MGQKESLVAIHFSFGPHEATGVTYLPTIRAQAEAFFLPTPARNIYILERAQGKLNYPEELRRLYKKSGSYIDAWTLATFDLGKNSTKLVIDENKEWILTGEFMKADSDLQDIQTAHKRHSTYFNAHHHAMLDKLARTHAFEVDYESHSPQTLQSLSRYFKEMTEAYLRSFNDRTAGDMDQALMQFQEAVRLNAILDRIRNRRYVVMLRDYTKQAVKRGTSTRIFLRLGPSHDFLLEQVSKDSYRELREAEVSFSYDLGARIPLAYVELTHEYQRDSNFRPSRLQLLVAMFERAEQGRLLSTVGLIEAQRLGAQIASETDPTKIEEYLQAENRFTPSG